MEVLQLLVLIIAFRFVKSKITLDKMLTNYNEKLSNWTAAVWSDDQGDGFFNSSLYQYIDVDKYLVRNQRVLFISLNFSLISFMSL